MLSDGAKIGILGIAYAICLVTLGTSPSITMGNGSLRTLAPTTRKHCQVPQKNARECHDNNCQDLKRAAQKCQDVVQRAYRHINLGGCATRIKAWTLCEDEWCQREMDTAACMTECTYVREALDDCKRQVVADYFRTNSLETDGTAKTL